MSMFCEFCRCMVTQEEIEQDATMYECIRPLCPACARSMRNRRDKIRRRLTRNGISLAAAAGETVVTIRHGKGAEVIRIEGDRAAAAETLCGLLDQWQANGMPELEKKSRRERAAWLREELQD